MSLPELRLPLPTWVGRALPPRDRALDDVRDRMRLVIALARENVARRTGGPFGAAVFDAGTRRLIAAGVNLVVAGHASWAHAEIVACALAQQILGHHDLGSAGMPVCELVTSVEPCAMCLGAIPWSGVRRVVCGARGEDAASVGFDEGPKHPEWISELGRRGVEVIRDVKRDLARDVLEAYAARGGPIYNGRGGRT